MELSLKALEQCFSEAIDREIMFIGVAVQIGDSPAPEIIINGKENFKDKLAYYKSAYNEDLTLKSSPTIKIVGFISCNSFDNIERNLL